MVIYPHMAKSKPYFDEVDLKVNFPEMEKKLVSEWYQLKADLPGR